MIQFLEKPNANTGTLVSMIGRVQITTISAHVPESNDFQNHGFGLMSDNAQIIQLMLKDSSNNQNIIIELSN